MRVCEIIINCVISSLSFYSWLKVTVTAYEENVNGLQSSGHFTRDWAVQIHGGQMVADEIAERNGYTNSGQLLGFEDVYVFHRANHSKRSKRHATYLTSKLTSEPTVIWAEQQIARPRTKRNVAHNSARFFMADPLERGLSLPMPYKDRRFNDELWERQWYLQDTRNIPYLPELDLRVSEAWNMGYSGKGVVITVLDDGLEWNHTDLRDNYDPMASYDINDNDADPFPRYDRQNSNSHGTRCAGEIAMSANNGKCGVGVAFNSAVGGIRCLDGEVTDAIEAKSLSYNIDHIHIYSASWGPNDDGMTVDGPKRLAVEAMRRGVTVGRQGKGVIYVWASGNGGTKGDNCNCDGYTSSIYTLSVGSASQQGQFPWYGERCASTMAVTYSSGAYTDQKIATADLHNTCTIDHSGTSAAAPLAAGIFALVLEANPNVTYRDVQHLVAATSEFSPLMENRGWKRNGAGLMYNSKFGFGLLNAASLVTVAKQWRPVGEKQTCIVQPATRIPQPISSGRETFVFFDTDGCIGTSSEVNSLEHVQIQLDATYTKRGSLDCFLVSPSGSATMLLSRRPRDLSAMGFKNWTLTSVHLWGERPAGQWRLMIRDKVGRVDVGTLNGIVLILHGNKDIPIHLRRIKIYKDEDLIPQTLDPIPEFMEEDMYDQNTLDNSLNPIPSQLEWNEIGLSVRTKLSSLSSTNNNLEPFRQYDGNWRLGANRHK